MLDNVLRQPHSGIRNDDLDDHPLFLLRQSQHGILAIYPIYPVTRFSLFLHLSLSLSFILSSSAVAAAAAIRISVFSAVSLSYGYAWLRLLESEIRRRAVPYPQAYAFHTPIALAVTPLSFVLTSSHHLRVRAIWFERSVSIIFDAIPPRLHLGMSHGRSARVHAAPLSPKRPNRAVHSFQDAPSSGSGFGDFVTGVGSGLGFVHSLPQALFRHSSLFWIAPRPFKPPEKPVVFPRPCDGGSGPT